MEDPKVIRWGILATGGIALAFAKDISLDPNTREVQDIKHQIVAAASSSSLAKATDFLHACGADKSANPYGTYQDLVNDSHIDIIYIATPHSHHFQNAMLCLEAGKNVLCEKPLTVNAKQARLLVEKSKQKNVLFMEALWTRYFPIMQYARDVISSGRLGSVDRVLAEHSLSYSGLFPNNENIMVNPNLAGGILLDAGIYSLTWVFEVLYQGHRPTIKSAISKYGPTGVDGMTTILLEFPRDSPYGNAHGIATTSLGLSNDKAALANDVLVPSVRIQGQQGELQIFPPTYRPTRSRIVLKDGTVEERSWDYPGPGAGSGWYNGHAANINPEGEGHGLFWEADDAGRAVLEGRKEGSRLGWDESILIMEIMDAVRDNAGFRYPDSVESVEIDGSGLSS